MENLISIEFSPSGVQEMRDFIGKIKSNLPNGMVTLKTEERHAYAKMGDRSIAFVQKALDFAELYPELVPTYVDVKELKKDMAAVVIMQSLLRQMEELTTLLDDSTLMAGSEAYTASLSIYSAAKDAARRNVQGAKVVVEELKQRFPGKKAKDNSIPV